MIKNIFRFLTYALLILMFLTGLALFIFRNNITEYAAGPELPLNASVAPSGAAAALDLGPLSEPRFLALKNNVVDFDFDKICYRPTTGITQVKTPVSIIAADLTTTEATTTAATTTVAVPSACVTGNSLPFLRLK
jgi:hypothetical protein